ncbi:hypothetical protein LVD17_26435 [Fulvivirga ulvae]|uniref:hypothetical protein n=1 Tax=Fulvivirga ulvae TaxID=2904245 RepID=UPI001F2F2FD6|nr:hypothetical protein [Fulvivirga ulvae]UII31831.1 hypothetical protein LVD17_26435 [Fulvivirga ulvae]
MNRNRAHAMTYAVLLFLSGKTGQYFGVWPLPAYSFFIANHRKKANPPMMILTMVNMDIMAEILIRH